MVLEISTLIAYCNTCRGAAIHVLNYQQAVPNIPQALFAISFISSSSYPLVLLLLFLLYEIFITSVLMQGKDQTVKVHPRTGHEGPEVERRCSSTLSLSLMLRGSGCYMPRPGRFTPEKRTRWPLHRRLFRPQVRTGQVRKILPQPGLDRRTVQPVGIRDTHYAIPAHLSLIQSTLNREI